MADRNVKVVLSLISSGYESGAAKAKAATDQIIDSTVKLDKEQQAAAKEAAKAAREAEQQAAKRKQAFSDLAGASLTAGVAILAGVGVATKAYADFDKQMSAVKSTGQDAVANFDALRDAAIEAGASTAFSASEAAQGIEELAKAGVSAKDVLAGGLTGALDLAAAGTLDVGRAAEITAVTLKQFELAGTDASRVADLLAAGAGKSVGEVHDLAEALKMSGTVAHQYGVSIEETVGTLAMFAENALIGSDAGTSFKQMLLQLAQPTGKARDLLEQYNISAYDAQGNFVGMAELAAQLSSGLGHLSQEQQNAALKTIFGADAIRSATILMNQGEEGVRGWTAAVSEQGFAAEMAATKLDNLAGDLEALGGAFESAFIKSGSGVNDFLRGFVQGATALVNVIGSIPGPVLATGTAMAGLAGAALVGAGGFIKLVQTGAELKSALGTVREAFPKLDAAMGKASGAAKAFGAAMGAITVAGTLVAIGQAAHSFKEIGVNADESAAAVRRFARSGSMSELDGLFRGLDTYLTPDLMGKVDGLGAALRTMADSTSGWGKMRGDIQGFLGMGGDIADAKVAFEQLDAALASVDAQTAADAFRLITEEAAGVGISVEQLAAMFPQYAAALRASAGASGEAKTGAQLLAEGLDATADSAQSATDSLMALGNAALALSGSEMGLEAAIDAATEAIKENGQSAIDNGAALDINTEKGRENKSALDQIAAASLKLTDAQIKNGESAAVVAASTARAREQFVAAARQMGLTEAAANQLADSYGLIPRSVTTNVVANGLASTRSALASLDNQMRALDGRIVRIDVRQTTRQFTAADGGVFDATPAGIVQTFAHGGFAGSFATAQPQIRPAGGAGVLWAEEGAGPWEAFISGHPAKRRRSRWLLEEVASRLGGQVSWATAYADGGIHAPVRYAPNYSPPPFYTSAQQAQARLHPDDLRALAGVLSSRPLVVHPVMAPKTAAELVRANDRSVR